MKIAVRLFVSSMLFGVAIAVAYGFTTHDPFGVVALGVMALALGILALFIVFAERDARLAADRDDGDAAAERGERVGVFALESYWPPLAACGAVLGLAALVFLPGISGALAGGAALLGFVALRALARESG